MRILGAFVIMMAAAAQSSYALDLGGWFGGSDIAKEKAERTYRDAASAYGSADYAKCIELSTEAIKQYPEMARAYALRGKAKKDMGNIDGAMADLDKAVELDPGLGEAYFIRAQANEIMGRMEKAGMNYKKACEAGYREACR